MTILSDAELQAAVQRLYELPSVRSARIVPERDLVAFIANIGETHQAYLWDIGGSDYRQLTDAHDPVAQCIPDRAGTRLALMRDTDGNELFRLSLLDLDSLDTGERLVTPAPPGRVMIVDWHPDGRRIVLAGNDDEDNFVSVLDLETGDHRKLFTSPRWLAAAALSEDGSLAAVSVPNNDDDLEDHDIAVVPLEGDTPVRWVSTGVGHRNDTPRWSPDGRRLALTAEIGDETWLVIYGWPEATEHGRVRIDGDEAALCYWAPDASFIDVITGHRGVQKLWRAAVGATLAVESRPEPGSIHAAHRTRDSVAVIGSAIDRPLTRIEVRDLDHRETASLDIATLDLPLGTPESVSFASADGTAIQGWFVPRKDTTPGPAVVYVHGGPTWAAYNAWRNDVQALALAGFTVVAPNYRGSTSFGPDFRKANVRDLGGMDLEDCLAAAEWLKARPEVDPARVAIAGASYGGYMTLWALVKSPETFVCGAGLVPVTDWVEDYELADAAFRYFDLYFFGGTPEDQPDLYRDRSPLTFIDALSAPLFINAGRNDSRCPFPPIEKIVEKGWELCKQIDFDIQESEGHGAARKTAAVATELKVLRFLRFHCGIEMAVEA